MKGFDELKKLALKATRNKYPSVPDHALPRKKYTDKNTNGLTKAIIEWINLNGFQAERINSMGRRIDKRKKVKDVLGNERMIGSVKWIKSTSQTGTADISATIKGKSVKIEVKCLNTGDNYQSPEQKLYQKQIEQAGGVYVIARTFQGFYEWYCEFVKW